MPKTVKIPAEVSDVLSRAITEGNRLILPAEQLPPDLYKKVDKVLKAMGGKWNRSAGAHVFTAGLPSDLSEVLAAGEVVDIKKTLEFFETPPELAKRMADAAAAVSDQIPRNIRVLEPSAGHGRLLAAFAEHLDTNGKDTVVAIDIHPANCDVLRAQGIATAVECDDFLAAAAKAPHAIFDVILMNPPFSKNQDIAHVTAAVKLVAEGGVLVALTSAHWLFAQDRASLDFLHMLGIGETDEMGTPMGLSPTNGITRVALHQIEAGAFRAEGTMVRPVMLVIRK